MTSVFPGDHIIKLVSGGKNNMQVFNNFMVTLYIVQILY